MVRSQIKIVHKFFTLITQSTMQKVEKKIKMFDKRKWRTNNIICGIHLYKMHRRIFSSVSHNLKFHTHTKNVETAIEIPHTNIRKICLIEEYNATRIIVVVRTRRSDP